jgi:CO dehydrogenase/acetyl-CoA synthase delta subunit
MSIALYGEIILVASTATGLNFYESASAAPREKHEVAAWNLVKETFLQQLIRLV